MPFSPPAARIKLDWIAPSLSVRCRLTPDGPQRLLLAGLLWAIKRPVSCSLVDRDQYGRPVAICLLGTPGLDIGQWLVATGHALDWPQYSKGKYVDAQRGAEKGNRGVWPGSFVVPETIGPASGPAADRPPAPPVSSQPFGRLYTPPLLRGPLRIGRERSLYW